MFSNPLSAPSPDLRIVPIDAILPHELSDGQRSEPLMRRLKNAEHFTNPPIVAEIETGRYVLMDGSNRHLSMRLLGFPHILAQVQEYNSAFVQLDTWRHVLADWDAARLLQELAKLPDLDIRPGQSSGAKVQIHLRDGQRYSIHVDSDDLRRLNATLSRLVDVYHRSATLFRTALDDRAQIWSLFPSGFAVIVFPTFSPEQIIKAALLGAYLPPGISRHIVQGRALNMDYPMARLRADLPLEDKNAQLQAWLRERYAARSIRYYAESTFQFAE